MAGTIILLMTDPDSIPRPSETIRLALRIFGGLFIFIGMIATLSVISVLSGDKGSIGGVVAGIILLSLGIGLIRMQKRFGRSFDEKLTGLRRNPDTGEIEVINKNRTAE